MSGNAIQKLIGEDVLALTADIVTAYVSNNTISTDDLPRMIHSVFSTLSSLNGAEPESPAVEQKPAVSPKKSFTDDYIICLEDGKKLKMLKRYLRTRYNLTPEEYRAKWNLPADYPMVAPNYAKQRSAFAKKIGLGKR
ncbi:MucR family transcriptional regulator [Gimibacter soli]|uniref:MucR family transcriptional regulator n=1 Tax=Gimibacter soli TaxID=3024400 RepID=UPI00336580E3